MSQPPTFRLTSIVAKRSPISATAELLSKFFSPTDSADEALARDMAYDRATVVIAATYDATLSLSNWRSQIANWHHKRMTERYSPVRRHFAATSFFLIVSGAYALFDHYAGFYDVATANIFLLVKNVNEMMTKIIGRIFLSIRLSSDRILYGGLLRFT